MSICGAPDRSTITPTRTPAKWTCQVAGRSLTRLRERAGIVGQSPGPVAPRGLFGLPKVLARIPSTISRAFVACAGEA
jgi:hypothetical protein